MKMFRVVDSEIVRNSVRTYRKAIVIAESKDEALKKYNDKVGFVVGKLKVREIDGAVFTYY